MVAGEVGGKAKEEEKEEAEFIDPFLGNRG